MRIQTASLELINTGGFAECGESCVNDRFDTVGFEELVSFTSKCNLASINVMKKIGMHEDPIGFEHPRIDTTCHLRKHVVFRLSRVGNADNG